MADQVLFDEVMDAFRRGSSAITLRREPTVSYFLSSFVIFEDWDLGCFTIHKTLEVKLGANKKGLVNKISNAPWVGTDANYFAEAVSTLFSFVSGTPAAAPRGNVFAGMRELCEYELSDISYCLPVDEAGPKAVKKYSVETQVAIRDSLICLCKSLLSVEYERYVECFQAVRLVALSIKTKRDDFGLGYLLVVSALESVAQRTISVEPFRERQRPKQWSNWSEVAKGDPVVGKLFKYCTDKFEREGFLGERFVELVFSYSTVEEWEQKVRHASDPAGFQVSQEAREHLGYLARKRWDEIYPGDLGVEELKRVIKTSYVHRSDFVHQGKQPPHALPHSRFFQKLFTGKKLELFPNYELMLGIAQIVITRWIEGGSAD